MKPHLIPLAPILLSHSSMARPPALPGPAVVPGARNFPKALLRVVEERWDELEGQSLSDNPWRDKRTFLVSYDELKEEHEPRKRDWKKAAGKLEVLLRKEKDPHFAWRVQQLLGHVYRDCGETEKAARAYGAALALYPLESYPAPSKQSMFHHLANSHAGMLWDLHGREAAEDSILELLHEDERMQSFSVSWWQDELEERAPERLAGFFGDVKPILAERAGRDPGFDAALEEIEGMVFARFVGGDPMKKFYVLGQAEPGEKIDLVLTLPGGNGQASEFLPWLTAIERELEPNQLMVVVSAPQWSAKQEKSVIWVTEWWRKTYGEAAFGVESFLEEILAELESEFQVRGASLFGWSSSGPAIYEAILREDSPWIGAYVHASVFKPQRLDLDRAENKRFFLRQGTSDRITPLHWAKSAERKLSKNGARVELDVYEGGHGWGLPDAGARIAEALSWIFSGNDPV